MATRPTSDKVKGSVFNILADYIADRDVLDIFAGTGSLGIEALSRGARSAVFMDKSPDSCAVIKDNLAHTKLADLADVYCVDYVNGIERLSKDDRKFDLIFIDPPYNKNFIQEALKLMSRNDIMKDNSIIITEHSASDHLPDGCGRLKAVDSRKYGDTMITIYKIIDMLSE